MESERDGQVLTSRELCGLERIWKSWQRGKGVEGVSDRGGECVM